jgi:anti-sigma B factor antagonist
LGMSIEITEQEREGIEILELKGRLTFGEEDLALREELEKLGRENKTKVVIMLGELHQIDTAGFGTLLFARDKLQAAGGGLALAGLNPAHIEVLMTAKLGVEFHTFEDELEAVNSFFPGREVHHFDVLQFVKSKTPPGE